MAGNKHKNKNKKGGTDKAPAAAMPVSVLSFFRSGRIRELPLHDCLASEDWREGGIVTALVSRRHDNGNISWVGFTIDLYCLGVRNCVYKFNKPEKAYEAFKSDKIDNGDQMTGVCGYPVIHSLVFGSLHYAESFGLRPHKNFGVGRFILEDGDGHVEKVACTLGREGRPLLIACC